MGAPTNYYVDPAIAANSGTGAIGDPYGDLQHALNTVTRDAVNGDQFNVKAGTSEILAAALSWTTYGTPTATAPCIIRGYTSAANDGGIGVVSGNGSVACINSGSLNHIKLVDMRWTNCGANTIITLSNNVVLLNCEIDTSTGSGVVLNANTVTLNCYIHNTGGSGFQSGVNAITLVAFNTFRNGTNDFTQAINAQGGAFLFNLIDIDGSSHGININANSPHILFNSVFSNGGTGVGIRNSSGSHNSLTITNNTVQGFSGVGGIGIQVVSQNADVVGYNLAFNNATNYSITGDVNVSLGNNDTAAVSPFTDAANDDFDPVAGLLALYPSYPTAWKNYASTQQNLIRMAAQYAASVTSVPGGAHVLGGFIVR